MNKDSLFVTTKRQYILQWHDIFQQQQPQASLCVDLENTKTLIRDGGIRTIVRAMKAHWSKAEVQQYASAALLVIGATDPSNHSVKSILKSGGVRALVGALHVHPEVAAVRGV